MPQIQTVAYIMQIFPYRTETFISREVDALIEQGIDVVTLSNQMPAIDSLDESRRRLKATTHYVLPLSILQMLRIIFAHVWWMTHNFLDYIYCVSMLIKEESRDKQIHKRNLKHFIGAVYLAYVIRNRGVQHIHAHYAINASTMALIISVLLDIPFTMTIHNIFFTDRTLMRVKLLKAKHVVCISNYSRDSIVREYSDIANLFGKLSVIHCGTDSADFQILGTNMATVKPYVIMTACQLVERKGVHYLIEACALLHQTGISFRCIIAGDGEERQILEALSLQLGIRPFVKFIGAYTHAELLDLFSESDLFVLPCIVAKNGDRDGIPIALMEAMAAGVPVVSTYVSGIPELIVDGYNGHLVAEKDIDALARIIRRYIDGDIAVEEQILAAKNTITKQFNIDTSVREIISLFESEDSGYV